MSNAERPPAALIHLSESDLVVCRAIAQARFQLILREERYERKQLERHYAAFSFLAQLLARELKIEDSWSPE